MEGILFATLWNRKNGREAAQYFIIQQILLEGRT